MPTERGGFEYPLLIGTSVSLSVYRWLAKCQPLSHKELNKYLIVIQISIDKYLVFQIINILVECRKSAIYIWWQQYIKGYSEDLIK